MRPFNINMHLKLNRHRYLSSKKYSCKKQITRTLFSVHIGKIKNIPTHICPNYTYMYTKRNKVKDHLIISIWAIFLKVSQRNGQNGFFSALVILNETVNVSPRSYGSTYTRIYSSYKWTRSFRPDTRQEDMKNYLADRVCH